MTQTTLTATRATAAAVPAVASVLARAFHEDPVFAWSLPDPDRRRDQLPAVFTAFAELYLPHGEVHLTGDGAGTALWAPPHVDPFGGAAGEAFGERIAALLDEEEAQRFLAVGELLGEHHPAQPWRYLQLIGVDPDRQGRGLGSQLLAPVLSRCDATGTSAYLEATTPDNRRLYQRYGFATLDEIALPEGGPPVWPMWREPAVS